MKKDTQKWKGAFGFLAIIASVLLILNYTGVIKIAQTEPETAYSQNANADNQTLTDFESAIIGAVEKVGDAVVTVNNYRSSRTNYTGSTLEQYFSSQRGGEVDLTEPEKNLELAGSGSGVVYKNEDGSAYLVTNNHVVDGAEKLSVITSGGEEVDAELVGTDVYTDLAVLKIDGSKVKAKVDFANSDELKVGSLAIAIGSPLDNQFSSSVTQGIVSGLNRVLPVDVNQDGENDWEEMLIQTDAAINPGNSGGPLLNKNGQLIGINSSKMSETGVEGMGFAIPSNQVQNIIGQLESKGKVERPIIGIINGVYPVNELSERSKTEVLGLAADADKGIVIREVAPNGPAQKAGLKEYDVITAIDGEDVDSLLSLRKILYRHQPGDTVEATIIRQGEEMKVQITLETAE